MSIEVNEYIKDPEIVDIKELLILYNDEIIDLNLQITAADQRKDYTLKNYLQGKKQGIARAIEILEG